MRHRGIGRLGLMTCLAALTTPVTAQAPAGRFESILWLHGGPPRDAAFFAAVKAAGMPYRFYGTASRPFFYLYQPNGQGVQVSNGACRHVVCRVQSGGFGPQFAVRSSESGILYSELGIRTSEFAKFHSFVLRSIRLNE